MSFNRLAALCNQILECLDLLFCFVFLSQAKYFFSFIISYDLRRILISEGSKAYDCLPHDLLIARLGAYGLDRSSLRLLIDHLNSRKQRKKVVHPTATGLKLNTEFRKLPYWDPYYSIYLQATYSLS